MRMRQVVRHLKHGQPTPNTTQTDIQSNSAGQR